MVHCISNALNVQESLDEFLEAFFSSRQRKKVTNNLLFLMVCILSNVKFNEDDIKNVGSLFIHLDNDTLIDPSTICVILALKFGVRVAWAQSTAASKQTR